jgi:nicotinamidase-related amidase
MESIVKVNSKETALLVIDVQRALFTRSSPVYETYAFLETINTLISRAHLFRVMVVYIQYSNDSILKKGTSGWDFHPDLSRPTNQDLSIHKTHGNAFKETWLHDDLATRGIKNLIITGLVTQGSIRATALGGLALDYKTLLVKGGHSNYQKDAAQVIEQHENQLENKGIVVVTPENIGLS